MPPERSNMSPNVAILLLEKRSGIVYNSYVKTHIRNILEAK